MLRAAFNSLPVLLWLIYAQAALAQPVDTTLSRWRELAQFREARALAVDPSGILYVSDVATDVVYRLTPGGVVLSTTGGPGIGEGEFDDPTDLDATNGLVLVVADRGNGRIQRFSREGAPIGNLTYRDLNEEQEEARFVSVAVADGRTYAVDETRNAVVVWDAGFRVERTIGAYTEGEGALGHPVALSVGGPERLLYVLDRRVGSVMLYDRAGVYMGAFGQGLEQGVNIITHSDQVYVLLPDRILLFTGRGRLLRTMMLCIEEPVTDVAFYKEKILVLTRRRLLTSEK